MKSVRQLVVPRCGEPLRLGQSPRDRLANDQRADDLHQRRRAMNRCQLPSATADSTLVQTTRV